MSSGTIQAIFNTRNNPTYGVGTSGTGGGVTSGLVDTSEYFLSEGATIGLLAASGSANSSARSTQGLVRFRGYAFADQVITVKVQVSVDGVNFRTPDTTASAFQVTAAAANAAVVWDVPACAPFMRVSVLNTGASTLTVMELVTDLIAGS